MLEELSKVNEYIFNKIEQRDPFLKELEIYAQENNVPIITKEVAAFLEFLIKVKKPDSILEIGTAIGYSGIVMAKQIKQESGRFTTIEIDENSYNLAVENFRKAGIGNCKTLLGDASDEIVKLSDNYDMIFMDAAKGQYMDFFEKSFPLLNDGGIMVIDNILFRGYVYSEEFPKKYSTIVKRLREFIDYLYKNYNFTLLPFGDGIGLIYKT